MKTKIFLFYIILCFTWQVKAQIGNNNTIVNDHSEWSILGIIVCPGCPVWTQYVYFDGDSVVAEHSYKKVFSCDDKLHENIKYEGLIREQNQKTYFISANSETEYLLYDFSLEEGMIFNYIEIPEYPVSLYVKKVDFVEIGGVQLKQIQLTEPPPYDYFVRATWIENIGSLYGLFYPCGMLKTGSLRELLCYFQNDELVYKNPVYSECYYDNLTSVQTVVIDDCYIYPNPFKNIVFISTNNVGYVEIFDVLGKTVYYSEINIGINEISTSYFLKGIYFIKIHQKDNSINSFKIIKL